MVAGCSDVLNTLLEALVNLTVAYSGLQLLGSLRVYMIVYYCNHVKIF